jgi:hypothetical protein
VARVLADLSFATGSAGFIAPLGLLIAGVAVPSMVLRLLPRLLAGAGLVVAAACVMSTLVLLTSVLYFTFPIGRFLGPAWLIAASVALPANRHSAG